MTDDAARLMIRTIGVIVPSNVGDAVLALPAIAELAQRFPKARLTVAGGARARAVFDGDPRVTTFIEYGADEHRWHDYLAAIARLRRERFDLLLDLRHTALPWLLRTRRRTNPLLAPPAALTHRHDRYRWYLERLLQSLGTLAPVALTPEQVWALTSEEKQQLEQLWAQWAIDGERPVIVVSPGARSDDKRWPAAQFVHVCDRLARDGHAQIIVTGESSERPIVEALRAGVRAPIRVAAGETTVRTLAALLMRCDAVVTNDSATLHVASSVNAPTVALFGPTDPAKYGPRSARSVMIRRNTMTDISVDDVLTAVRTLVGAGLKPAPTG